jgi:hypothetical protein
MISGAPISGMPISGGYGAGDIPVQVTYGSLDGRVGLATYLDGLVGIKPYLDGSVGLKEYTEGITGSDG